jgi:histidinol-phosphate aminotransferase
MYPMTIRPRQSLLNPELHRPSALSSVPRDEALLWLDKNENLDSELIAFTSRLLAELPALAFSTYPEAGALYRKLGEWVGVAPESLLLTPGSDGAIRLVFEAFVEQDDPVVHTTPTFAMYPVYSQMFGAKPHAVEYRREGDEPALDTDAFERAVREHKPKLACLPNPDSPTGTVVPPEFLRRLLATCENTGTVLLVDEAYYPFYERSVVAAIDKSRNIIVARTFAKAWGAAGLRIGYAVAHPDTIALLHKMRPMYEVSTVAVEFMSRMLDSSVEMQRSVERIREGKDFFVEAMRALGLKVLPTFGNFVHVAFAEHGPAVHAALATRVLYRVRFDHPSLGGYSRFSVAPKPVMEEVVRIIQQVVRGDR